MPPWWQFWPPLTSCPLLKSSSLYPNYSLCNCNPTPHAPSILFPHNDSQVKGEWFGCHNRTMGRKEKKIFFLTSARSSSAGPIVQVTVQVEMMSSNSVYVFSCSSSAGPIVSSVNGMTVLRFRTLWRNGDNN